MYQRLVNCFTCSEKDSVTLHCCCPTLSRQEHKATGTWLVSQDWCCISVAPLFCKHICISKLFSAWRRLYG